jgi:hypothetical protein
MFQVFKPTGWRFVTSGGGEILFGLSKLVFAGGAGGAFYARPGPGPIYRLPYVAAAAGAGVGLSAGGLVTTSLSLPFAPGGGFQIYRNPARSGPLRLDDFLGSFIQISVTTGAFAFNRSVSLLIFGAAPWLVSALSLGNIIARLPMVLLACQGFGVLWGSAITSAVGAGIEGYTGQIVGHETAAPGETG